MHETYTDLYLQSPVIFENTTEGGGLEATYDGVVKSK